MSEKRKKVFNFRMEWDRDPVEKTHSTKKGSKGYDRNKLKNIRNMKEIAEDDLEEMDYILEDE